MIASMIAESKRNPRVLAGEVLEKIGAIDLKPLDEESGSTASQFLTNRGAIKGALEQIKLGRILNPQSSWTPSAETKSPNTSKR